MPSMQRMGLMIRLRPEAVEEYERIHREVWPAVLARIRACHIRNYTIFLRRPELLLFATWEYHGTDFAADMEQMRQDEATQRWWKITEPMQLPLESRAPGEWWATMDEVFHTD